MRVISIDNIMPGNILMQTIYGRRGEVLLPKNTVLSAGYISRLRQIGITRCCVEDDLSEGIRTHSNISDSLRILALNLVTEIYQNAQEGKQQTEHLKHLTKVTDDIIDEIIHNRDIVCDMTDLKTYYNFTFSHSVSVALLSIATGIKLGFNHTRLRNLAIGGFMHDIGKMFIPAEIMSKPSQLTDEEIKEVQLHPKKGYRYLKNLGNFSDEVCVGVLEHHKQMDAKGYPNQHSGEKIGLYGRIYSICDVYDAIISDRPQRKAWSVSEGIEYIMANGGRLFDPEIINAFISHIVLYPEGTVVKLSNGYKAIVEKNGDIVTRPIVRVFEKNNQSVNIERIDLTNNINYLNVTIESTVKN